MPWSFSRRLVDLFLVSDQFQAHTHEGGIAIAPSGILGPLLPLFLLAYLSGSSSICLRWNSKIFLFFLRSHGRLLLACCGCVCLVSWRYSLVAVVDFGVSLWELLLVRSEGEGRGTLPILATGQSDRGREALLASSSWCGDKSGGHGIEFIGGVLRD